LSKEKAVSLLSTARYMESPEDMRGLIDKALLFLRDEPEIVPGLRHTFDMIYDALQQLQSSLPDSDDTLSLRAEKISICESALLQIKEYAATGLKIRQQGSHECAYSLIHNQMQVTLEQCPAQRIPGGD